MVNSENDDLSFFRDKVSGDELEKLKAKYKRPDKKKSIEVVQYDLEGNFIHLFPSINAVTKYGFKTIQVDRVVKHINTHGGGFFWVYRAELPGENIPMKVNIPTHGNWCVNDILIKYD